MCDYVTPPDRGSEILRERGCDDVCMRDAPAHVYMCRRVRACSGERPGETVSIPNFGTVTQGEGQGVTLKRDMAVQSVTRGVTGW